jgi:hypothetical protein
MQEGLRNKELQVVKLDKRAYHGEEIDLDKYLLGGKDHPYLEKLDALSDENKQDMLIAGSQSCLSNPGLYVYRAGRFAPECA